MPASFLKIGGALVQDAILQLVEVTQELNRHWWCSVECRQTLDRRIAVEDLLGKDLQVLTHDQAGAEHVVFDGFVAEASLRYEVFGSYTARLKAVTRSYRLEISGREAYYRKQTLSGVTQSLCGVGGVAASVVAKDGLKRNFVQWGEPDFHFLVRLADDHQAWIRPTAAGIEVRDSFDSGVKVEWRQEDGLLDFEVEGALAPAVFDGTHYDPRQMRSVTHTAVAGSPAWYPSSAPLVAAVGKESKSGLPAGALIADGRAATADEYKTALERESLRAAANFVVGHGFSQKEDLRAGNTVEIAGVLDGKGIYGLTKVIHRWGRDGYTNEFWCTPAKVYLPPTRLAPPEIAGVVTARVVDQNDPRKMGRVKVQYDWQESGPTAWIRATTPHAGQDRGVLFLPEIGDEVVVAFEHGDPERPYIVGRLWNGVDQAPREEFWGEDVAPNDVKRIVTKSGHRIQLVDKPGKESIVIATPEHLKIALIEKTDETGRSALLLHSDGDIFLNAPGGRVHLHAATFTQEVGGGGSGAPASGGAPPPRMNFAAAAPASQRNASTAPGGSAPGKTSTPQESTAPKVPSDLAKVAAALSPPTRSKILGKAQAQRAQARYQRLSKEDQASFDRLLQRAKSDDERAYLRKGLAAGHSVPALQGFANRIRGKDKKWMNDHLRLTGASDGRGVQQQWHDACGPTTVQAVRGELDPLYALKVHDQNPKFNSVDNTKATRRNPKLAEEQRKLLEKKRPDGSAGKAVPRVSTAGSGRWVDDELNDISDVTGVKYTNQKVPGDAPLKTALSNIDKGLAKGAPVPIVVGNSKNPYGHYALITAKNPATARTPATYTVHDPWTGTTKNIPVSDFENSTLDIAGWSTLGAIENPSVQSGSTGQW